MQPEKPSPCHHSFSLRLVPRDLTDLALHTAHPIPGSHHPLVQWWHRPMVGMQQCWSGDLPTRPHCDRTETLARCQQIIAKEIHSLLAHKHVPLHINGSCNVFILKQQYHHEHCSLIDNTDIGVLVWAGDAFSPSSKLVWIIAANIHQSLNKLLQCTCAANNV